MPIGVFDSGLGGLTILQALVAKLPQQGFVYLADSAAAPYGTRPPEQIAHLTAAGVARLFEAGCALVVVACNTASAVALRDLQAAGFPEGRNALGVLVPLLEAVAGRRWADTAPPTRHDPGDIALLATPATVASAAVARELALRASGLRIVGEPCPGLVDAIESGDRSTATALARAAVGRLLKTSPRPQSALLGCTHYPLVQAAFEAALPPGTPILSQAGLVALSLEDYLRRHPQYADQDYIVRYLTTGDPQTVSDRARLFLGHAVSFGPA